MDINNNNNDTHTLKEAILGQGEYTIHLKSGQSFECIRGVAPLRFSPPPSSLAQLKTLVSHYLGDTPSASSLVLAREEGGALFDLKERDVSFLKKEETLFVFSTKTWNAYAVIQGACSTVEERRNAVIDAFSLQDDTSFMRQLRLAQQASLKDEAVQEARKRLAERIALFGLAENPDIDQEGDCQFDAAGDQLRKHQQFAGETKESVRARAVKWIRDNAGCDFGHNTTVRQWVQALPEYSSFDDYLEKMARAKWWGDEVTLLAICESYQVGVVMLSSVQGGNWYRILYPVGHSEKDELPQLWLGHEHERHYWSLMISPQLFTSNKEDTLGSLYTPEIRKESDSPKEDSLFIAVERELRCYEQFQEETRVSVHSRVGHWIRDGAPQSGEVILRAICELYEVSIVVRSLGVSRILHPEGKGPKDQLPHLWLEHCEKHYWSLPRRMLRPLPGTVIRPCDGKIAVYFSYGLQAFPRHMLLIDRSWSTARTKCTISTQFGLDDLAFVLIVAKAHHVDPPFPQLGELCLLQDWWSLEEGSSVRIVPHDAWETYECLSVAKAKAECEMRKHDQLFRAEIDKVRTFADKLNKGDVLVNPMECQVVCSRVGAAVEFNKEYGTLIMRFERYDPNLNILALARYVLEKSWERFSIQAAQISIRKANQGGLEAWLRVHLIDFPVLVKRFGQNIDNKWKSIHEKLQSRPSKTVQCEEDGYCAHHWQGDCRKDHDLSGEYQMDPRTGCKWTKDTVRTWYLTQRKTDEFTWACPEERHCNRRIVPDEAAVVVHNGKRLILIHTTMFFQIQKTCTSFFHMIWKFLGAKS